MYYMCMYYNRYTNLFETQFQVKAGWFNSVLLQLMNLVQAVNYLRCSATKENNTNDSKTKRTCTCTLCTCKCCLLIINPSVGGGLQLYSNRPACVCLHIFGH